MKTVATLCLLSTTAVVTVTHGHADSDSISRGCARFTVDQNPGPDCQFIPSSSGVTGINETGTISGGLSDCDVDGHAAVWFGQDAWLTVSNPPGTFGIGLFDINSASQAAGTVLIAENPQIFRAAFYEVKQGTTEVIGVLPGHNNSEGYAVNDSGAVCGLSTNNVTGPLQGFVWQDGVMAALALPLGPNSVAYDISNTGWVCGWMGQSPYIDAHVFMRSKDQVLDLGVILEGAIGADARSISRDGHTVCGFAVFSHADPSIVYQRRAYVRHDGRSEDLGVLGEYVNSWGLAVNDAGVAVGYCNEPPKLGQSGFIWRNGVMTDLNDLIPPELQIHITDAVAINNAGQIACNAQRTDGSFDQVAVRLTPIQPPPGDCDCNGQIDMDDLLGVINQWGPTIPTTTADFNNDGIVSVDDLVEVLRLWSR